ncbi:MAG: hypothetical protein QXW62_02855 [Candidatus Methanomethylicaceae archaeon]|nr:hypothetical protein [Candidatus Verstraetearchaeota archaeon]
MQDEFKKISDAIISMLKEKGKLSFSELEEWAKENKIGIITLKIILNELIEIGDIIAPEGFYENGSYFEPPAPKFIELAKPSSPELEKLKDYLREYRSVGILRLFEDMVRMGMKDVNEILKKAIKEGYAEITPSGVINATEKLLKSHKIQQK